MAAQTQFPTDVWIYACLVPPYEGSPYPSGCDYQKINGAVLDYEGTQATKEQYDAMFGAVLAIVALVIAFGLIKKAIEQ